MIEFLFFPLTLSLLLRIRLSYLSGMAHQHYTTAYKVPFIARWCPMTLIADHFL